MAKKINNSLQSFFEEILEEDIDKEIIRHILNDEKEESILEVLLSSTALRQPPIDTPRKRK